MFSTAGFSTVSGAQVYGFWLGRTRAPGAGGVDIDCRIDAEHWVNYKVRFAQRDFVSLGRIETVESMREKLGDGGRDVTELSFPGLPGPAFVQLNHGRSGYRGYGAWFSPAGYSLGIEVVDSQFSLSDEDVAETLPLILEYVARVLLAYYPAAAETAAPSPSPSVTLTGNPGSG